MEHAFSGYIRTTHLSINDVAEQWIPALRNFSTLFKITLGKVLQYRRKDSTLPCSRQTLRPPGRDRIIVSSRAVEQPREIRFPRLEGMFGK